MNPSEEHIELAERARSELDAQSPQDRRRAADVVRQMADGLPTEEQRAAAEQVARSLEAWGDDDQVSRSSPAA